MSNPLFAMLNGGAAQPSMLNMKNALSQLKANPSEILRQSGFNIPNGVNDPQSIINYLLNSGQIDQGRLTMAKQMASRFKL